MTRARGAVLLVVVAAALLAGIAGAAAPLPTPGTPSQVAALVAASHSIERLPKDLVPPLTSVAGDNAAAYYPATSHGCTSVTQCVYGDKTATTTVVLFGDSHAAMWLPPLVWDGAHLSFRVVLLWWPGCPVADVTVWDSVTHSVNHACDPFRSSALQAIARLDPALVLTSNRTSNVMGADDRPIENDVWRAGLESTLTTLLDDHLKVAVIGDVTGLSSQIPQCLAAYPTHVQRCSSPNPNPALRTHNAAESKAAAAEGVPYLTVERWLCTSRCSPVVGDLVVMNDWQHVSATYAAYLAIDWEGLIKPLLPGG